MDPEKAAAHRLGLSHSTSSFTWRTPVEGRRNDDAQLVWMIAARLPEPEDRPRTEE